MGIPYTFDEFEGLDLESRKDFATNVGVYLELEEENWQHSIDPQNEQKHYMRKSFTNNGDKINVLLECDTGSSHGLQDNIEYEINIEPKNYGYPNELGEIMNAFKKAEERMSKKPSYKDFLN